MSESAQATDKPNYKKTLCLLSKQEADAIFPQRAKLPEREPDTLKYWDENRIYHRLIEERAGQKQFVFHDGPPYANGHIHLGTSLNKVLKDIMFRSRSLAGERVPITPGWDCHGLPIEHKVMQEIRAEGSEVTSKLALRKRCRDYALAFIGVMTEEFKRLGVLADWENPYRTLDPPFEAAELRVFAKLVERGMVYRSLKPVYWCPGYETALAEAEVEYHDHTSPSIYVKFPSVDVEEVLEGDTGDPTKPLSVLIWTTTPWTLPANLAVTLHPRFEYVVLETATDRMIVARELVDRVAAEVGLEGVNIHDAPSGDAFEKKRCRHPFLDQESLILNGELVTLEAGSGCVHTAPGHGHEDYLIGMKYELPVYSPVDSRGRFTDEFPEFAGVPVEKADPGIIELLEEKGALLWQGKLSHSYPPDWREKKPVIFRATPQWFVSLEKGGLREELLKAVDQVTFIPKWGRARIEAMLENRAEWCISRQRSWGVPIPAIHVGDEAILDPEFIDAVAGLVEETGVDVWFEALEGVENEGTGRLRKLVGEMLGEKGLDGDWKLETDTLDVWFDSGSSHQGVLNERYGLTYPADLYLEGSDQHRGWFQSSLITAVANGFGAPYKAVLTHGYVVDEKGEKLSKSKGNYVEAAEAVREYGADVLRLWIASEDFRGDISVSKNILKQSSDAYRRFRNTFRFLLTSLSDFSTESVVPEKELMEIDRYELLKWQLLERQIREAYDDYEYHRVYHLANAYCTVDLSARYLDILKDRLYTFRKDGPERRSAQTVLHSIAKGLARSLSPLLAYTCEETWQSLRRLGLAEEESVVLTSWDDQAVDVDEELFSRWETLFELRETVTAAIEPHRRDGEIGQSLEADIGLWFDNEADYERANYALGLQSGSDLASLFIVSNVTCQRGPGPGECVPSPNLPGVATSFSKADRGKCVRCWRFPESIGSHPDHPELCDRCLEAVQASE